MQLNHQESQTHAAESQWSLHGPSESCTCHPSRTPSSRTPSSRNQLRHHGPSENWTRHPSRKAPSTWRQIASRERCGTGRTKPTSGTGRTKPARGLLVELARDRRSGDADAASVCASTLVSPPHRSWRHGDLIACSPPASEHARSLCRGLLYDRWELFDVLETLDET